MWIAIFSPECLPTIPSPPPSRGIAATSGWKIGRWCPAPGPPWNCAQPTWWRSKWGPSICHKTIVEPSLMRAHVRPNVWKHKCTCASFNLHDSSHNLTQDLPHPCDYSASGWEMRCSKRRFLGFGTFSRHLWVTRSLQGQQQSICRKNSTKQLIFWHILSWALSFPNSPTK